MPIVLSLSRAADTQWIAGPEGLYQHTSSGLVPVMQPQAELTCCLATDDTLLVGGAPHGVAFSGDNGTTWQAGWLDGVASKVLCLAAAPDVAHSGLLLAGSEESGIWRSRNSGQTWTACNVGLFESTIICLTWAPPPPPHRWPAWDVVFAGAEHGIYRSPNGGRAWKHSDGITGAVECIAIGHDFHTTGQVFAGVEGNGLWRSTDGGRRFERLSDTPDQINAIAAVTGGWILSNEESLWHSDDGETWHPMPSTTPAMVLSQAPDGIWAGGIDGVSKVTYPQAVQP